MSEYREEYNINPIKLYKKDIIELEDILKESVPNGLEYELKISTEYKEKTISDNSVETFFN